MDRSSSWARHVDYTYDGAGRLVQAYNCANPNEGEDTNRTNVTITPTSGSATSTDYCYNSADQLVSTTSGGTTSTSYSYDGDGNQTTDGTTTYTWDASGRLASATSGSTSVTYTDDALNRLLKTVQGSTTSKYSYSGFSDSPVAELNTSGQVQQQYVALPGGVQVTVQTSGNIWSYPNLQGDIIATTNQSGGLIGSPVTYDPWGSLYPTTQNAPANTNSGTTMGAYGADGKLQQNAVGDTVVFLGARALDPSQGRFLSVDPIDGGCANRYVYVFGDPLTHQDLDGQDICGSITAQDAIDVADGIFSPASILVQALDIPDWVGDIVASFLDLVTGALEVTADQADEWARGQRTQGNSSGGTNMGKDAVGMVAMDIPTVPFTSIPIGPISFIPWVKNGYGGKGINPYTG